MNYKPNLQPKVLIGLRRCLFKPAIAALVWTWGLSSPGFAAEQLKVKFGPFEQSVTVTELEKFVKTGALSPTLKPYAIVLTPEIRQTLSSRLPLKPLATQSMTSQQSLTGNRLLKLLGTIAQGATSQQLQLALAQGERQTEGLSLIAFLKAFPERTVVIDARAALEALPQIKPDTLGSQSLGLRLTQDLVAASGPFRPSFDPAAPGPAAVQVKTLTLQDQPRNRTIPVDLYWSTHTQGPLVVVSHGSVASENH